MALVALVGRPNVGKSALFNRMTQTRRAIVADQPGVTRDRLYEHTDWNGVPFTVVDTGGIWMGEDTTLLGMTLAQTRLAIAEADVLVLVVDGQEGVTAADEAVVDLLRRTQKPVLLAVNKAESPRVVPWDFYRLGLGEPLLVSATHGQGIGELLDRIVERLPAPVEGSVGEPEGAIRVAIAGRPNVGKSSLLNRLVGEERTLVTPIAGTTRDVVDSLVEHEGQRYLLLDTAGLRRPSRIAEQLEARTVARTLEAIRRADVVLIVLEATAAPSGQDLRIAGHVARTGKAAVVLLNKADLVRGTTRPLVAAVRERLAFLDFVTVLPISALTGWQVDAVWAAVAQAWQSYQQRVPTHHLNQVVQEAVHLAPPPAAGTQVLRVYYATQVAVGPPRIVLFVNRPELLTEAYRRYLEHRLRDRFGFWGTPLVIEARARRRSEGR
ncbi:MAG: ribosome biogenesis GTPase Der [Firmicutes bacterium]|nr:ribosome biogenesis GTPase Der [Alicyclobacillaceae bacterium]MCL6496776.1 ribosome biogenesis GTPase Der [Bacillota bacterium]